MLSADLSAGSACVHALQRAAMPLVVVPPGVHMIRPLHTVLAPLDGTPEAADAITRMLTLFLDADLDIVVLHVFTEQTVPAYWDQPVHAAPAWEREFLNRFVGRPGVRLQWRAGDVAEHVLDRAKQEAADLIVLGWSQHLTEGRAATVRQALKHSPVPVLLMPTR